MAGLLGVAFSGVSCKTVQPLSVGNVETGRVASPGPVSTRTPSGWVAVQEEPPVYFPEGVSEDAETDYRHGEWVFAGERDAWFFIPFEGNGIRTAADLTEQALAQRTKAQKRAIAADRFRDKATRAVGGTIGLTTVGTLTAATVVTGLQLSGGTWAPDPGAVALEYGESMEGSPLENVLMAVRHSGKDLYNAKTLSDFQQSRVEGRGTTPMGESAESDRVRSGLSDDRDELLYEQEPPLRESSDILP